MAKKRRVYSSAKILEKYDLPEIEIDGKVFTVASHLPMSMISAMSQETLQEGGAVVLEEFLAALLGVDVEEIKALDLDIRAFREIIGDLNEMVLEQIDGAAKNPTEAETSSQK